MKDWQISLAIIAALSASLALADDFKTINGKEYKNATVTVSSRTASWSSFMAESRRYSVELPPEIQKKYGYDPKAAGNFQQQQPATSGIEI